MFLYKHKKYINCDKSVVSEMCTHEKDVNDCTS